MPGNYKTKLYKEYDCEKLYNSIKNCACIFIG